MRPRLGPLSSRKWLRARKPARRTAAFGALSLALSVALSAADYSITERAAHHRVWERVEQKLQPSGRVLWKTNRYVELGTGICYQRDGMFRDTEENIEIINGFGVARNGPHQVIFAGNANSPGAVDCLMSDGQRFVASVTGLAYFDRATGRSVMIGELQDSIGELMPRIKSSTAPLSRTSRPT